MVNFESGTLKNVAVGLAVSTYVNVLDKTVLKGKLTSIGFNTGKTLNGKPLTFNATDALALGLTTGISLGGKSLMPTVITLAQKKYFESKAWIDPYDASTVTNPVISNAATMQPQIVYQPAGNSGVIN